jgi:RHH-type transcriptional regulator, rel operon repressor / antitoxin RelB
VYADVYKRAQEVAPMTSATFTIRVDEADKARLEALARSTGRSRSFLAAEAIAEYLAVNEWQIPATRTAMNSLDRGERVAPEAVRDWVDSWETERELERPNARRA